ncbi:MAG TPA: hypothetical protein VFY04_00030 [Solirubrobacterales bacterium]|nr:hypothetical protein [Solirubrobacterales bacterium]
MRLLLATNHLGLGGSESYLLTVAEQLDRLGHETVLYTPEPEGGIEVARERAITLLGEAALDGAYDAAIVQDAGVSLAVADRQPALRQLYVAHSAEFDLQTPPQFDGLVGAVVVLNDRVAERMRSLATKAEVVRLRQPIDTVRFGPRGTLPEVPRKALLLSNTPHSDRLTMLEQACAAAGLELSRLGGLAGRVADIRPALAETDVVIGYGRSTLEAMAFGRAAYVFDWKGGDGWVTPESYPAMEANGIAGGACETILDAERLADDLRGYAASMGPVNHDIVMTHHRANVHAQQLVSLIERLAPPATRPRSELQEMARLVRLEWRARLEISGLANENDYLRKLLDATRQQVGEERRRADEAERRVDEQAKAYEATASWRLTRPLRALGRLRERLSSLWFAP